MRLTSRKRRRVEAEITACERRSRLRTETMLEHVDAALIERQLGLSQHMKELGLRIDIEGSDERRRVRLDNPLLVPPIGGDLA